MRATTGKITRCWRNGRKHLYSHQQLQAPRPRPNKMVRTGEHQQPRIPVGLLTMSFYWQLRFDLGKYLKFLFNILSSSLWLDMLILSDNSKHLEIGCRGLSCFGSGGVNCHWMVLGCKLVWYKQFGSSEWVYLMLKDQKHLMISGSITDAISHLVLECVFSTNVNNNILLIFYQPIEFLNSELCISWLNTLIPSWRYL